MRIWESFQQLIAGQNPLSLFLFLFVVVGLAAGVLSGFFKARKIQPNGFRWKTFRNEAIFAVITIAISAAVLGFLTSLMTAYGLITVSKEPVGWWVIAAEYVVYFLAFDTYFYWFHRWMHIEPFYKYVHKLHHYSTSPNLLTTLSVHPLESLINGGFVPLFTAAVVLHEPTMALIGPTNILMGLYVHSGYDFLPRWWNKSWATKWFITTTFHDQHHKYFNFNFGGYTPIWDKLCGTQRPKYDADWETLKTRNAKLVPAPVAAMDNSSAG